MINLEFHFIFHAGGIEEFTNAPPQAHVEDECNQTRAYSHQQCQTGAQVPVGDVSQIDLDKLDEEVSMCYDLTIKSS